MKKIMLIIAVVALSISASAMDKRALFLSCPAVSKNLDACFAFCPICSNTVIIITS